VEKKRARKKQAGLGRCSVLAISYLCVYI